MTDTVRLATHLADLLGCSRREAEQYIEGAGVQVDGRTVDEPGFRVKASQNVALIPGARSEPVPPVTLLLNKPAGVSTNPAGKGEEHPLLALIRADTRLSEGDSTRFLNKHRKGLEVVTPLETGATGLVVLSQDHRIKRKLEGSREGVEQEYIVEIDGRLDEKGLARLNEGVLIGARRIVPNKVSWQNETHLRFAMKHAEKGLIADMCDQVEVAVVGIRRVRIGRLPLAQLALGHWRYLRGFEKF